MRRRWRQGLLPSEALPRHSQPSLPQQRRWHLRGCLGGRRHSGPRGQGNGRVHSGFRPGRLGRCLRDERQAAQLSVSQCGRWAVRGGGIRGNDRASGTRSRGVRHGPRRSGHRRGWPGRGGVRRPAGRNVSAHEERWGGVFSGLDGVERPCRPDAPHGGLCGGDRGLRQRLPERSLLHLGRCPGASSQPRTAGPPAQQRLPERWRWDVSGHAGRGRASGRARQTPSRRGGRRRQRRREAGSGGHRAGRADGGLAERERRQPAVACG